MKIFLTGSTGLVGKHLLRRLRQKHEIIECSRQKGLDILDKEKLLRAMQGCDIVIHTAAETNENARDVRKINVEGTRNLLEAGKKAAIKQFVHISTMGVYGSITTLIREDSPQKPINAYEKSKKAAEEAVREYQSFFPITIFRPTLIVGANAYWKKIFEMVRKGYPILGNGKNSWQLTYVEDLVSAIEYSLGNPRTYNEDFLVVSDEEYSFGDVINAVAHLQGVKRPISVPLWIGEWGSHPLSWYARVTGTKALLTPYSVKKLGENRRFDSSKLRQLGWDSHYSLHKALSETYAELKSN